jgi:tetratricopeptide (TPR) repeat protein
MKHQTARILPKKSLKKTPAKKQKSTKASDERIDRFKKMLSEWKAQGWDVSKLEVVLDMDTATASREFSNYEARMKRALAATERLAKIDARGHEDTVARIKSNLLDPFQVGDLEMAILALESMSRKQGKTGQEPFKPGIEESPRIQEPAVAVQQQAEPKIKDAVVVPETDVIKTLEPRADGAPEAQEPGEPKPEPPEPETRSETAIQEPEIKVQDQPEPKVEESTTTTETPVEVKEPAVPKAQEAVTSQEPAAEGTAPAEPKADTVPEMQKPGEEHQGSAEPEAQEESKPQVQEEGKQETAKPQDKEIEEVPDPGTPVPYPQNSVAWVNLGRGLRDGERAKVGGMEYTVWGCYQKALEHDSQNAVAWFELGNSLKGGGAQILIGMKLYTAQECFRKSLEIEPRSATGWFNLCSTMSDTDLVQIRGRMHARIDCLLESLACDPNLAIAWNELGLILKGGQRVLVAGREYTARDCIIRARELGG